jgi:surface antigen
MNYSIDLSIEEISLMRNALDAVQIQGSNAKLVAGLQTKLEDSLFQIQMNIQMQEQERLQAEQEKQKQLEALLVKEAKKQSKS